MRQSVSVASLATVVEGTGYTTLVSTIFGLYISSHLPSPEIEQSEYEADHTPQPLNAEVKNIWSFTYSSHNVFIASSNRHKYNFSVVL